MVYKNFLVCVKPSSPSLQLDEIEDWMTKFIYTKTGLKFNLQLDGLYEIRLKTGSDIYRILCCSDSGRLVILLNGFQKKSDKTPKKEIERGLRLKKVISQGLRMVRLIFRYRHCIKFRRKDWVDIWP